MNWYGSNEDIISGNAVFKEKNQNVSRSSQRIKNQVQNSVSESKEVVKASPIWMKITETFIVNARIK